MTTLVARPKAERVLGQLQAAGLVPHIASLSLGDDCVRGVMRLDVLEQLRRDCYDERGNPLGRFREGPFWTLHQDVGADLTEFRSEMGIFGEGSLQLVIDQVTGRFYCDIDKFSPYEDVRGAFGHFFGEVIPAWAGGAWGWLSRRGRRKETA